MTRHWTEAPYWAAAVDELVGRREKGLQRLVIDLEQVEKIIYDGDSPAYRTMKAMLSVHEHEGSDGYRGAPRVVLALLYLLSEENRKARAL